MILPRDGNFADEPRDTGGFGANLQGAELGEAMRLIAEDAVKLAEEAGFDPYDPQIVLMTPLLPNTVTHPKTGEESAVFAVDYLSRCPHCGHAGCDGVFDSLLWGFELEDMSVVACPECKMFTWFRRKE